jgi:hypothetical protein
MESDEQAWRATCLDGDYSASRPGTWLGNLVSGKDMAACLGGVEATLPAPCPGLVGGQVDAERGSQRSTGFVVLRQVCLMGPRHRSIVIPTVHSTDGYCRRMREGWPGMRRTSTSSFSRIMGGKMVSSLLASGDDTHVVWPGRPQLQYGLEPSDQLAICVKHWSMPTKQRRCENAVVAVPRNTSHPLLQVRCKEY